MITRIFSHLGLGWLIVGAILSIATVLWLSDQAIVRWQQGAQQLAERRAETNADLLVTVLARNMTAAQASLVSSHRSDVIAPITATLDFVTSALASYAYPEAFFKWHGPEVRTPVMFYVRSERYPSWMPQDTVPSVFPVTSFVEPTTGRRLFDRIERDALLGRDYSIFDITFGASTYQVVALLTYSNPYRDGLTSVLGFMVNRAWVREHYFNSFTALVARMGDTTGEEPFVVTEQHSASSDGAVDTVGYRTIPLLFFDPRLVASDWPSDLGRDRLTVHAVVSNDAALKDVQAGARRTRIIVLVFALAPVIGLVLTLRAERRSTALAELRSELVSSVTHELKTPIATIRAISEIFATHHSVTPEVSRKHGRLALHEAKRLTRLIDNLLAYARITDVTEAYSFKPLSVQTLVEQTLSEFESQLEFLHFDVEVDVRNDLPPITADLSGMVLALGNLVDNAIRYSPNSQFLRVVARSMHSAVAIEIIDHGVGISADDLPHVTKRFVSGQRGPLAGSGLGLAIAERIVSDHRGSLTLESSPEKGTTAIVQLPVAVA